MKKFLAVALLLGAMASTVSPGVPDWLDAWYRGYNSKYFNSELPAEVLIDHDLHDDKYIALTDYNTAQKKYWLRFNPKYGASSKQVLMSLFHEMCHVRSMTRQELIFDDHGVEWETCMHELADKGAYDDLW